MNERVLIVEDESIVADDLAWKLQKLGYEVVGIAASGTEALELAEKERPSIVLMDVHLQDGVTGVETARSIQMRTGAAIIFVTAFAAVLYEDQRLEHTHAICLSKPFSIVQLKSALEAVSFPG